MSDVSTASESDATPFVKEWAMEAARSIDMARRLSRWCLWLAGLTAAVGLVTAALWVSTSFDEDQFSPWEYSAASAGSLLLDALLAVAVLLTASGLLRLYAIRFETELLPDGEDDGSDQPR